MAVASRYHVLFRERSDGYWDYFPRGHRGPGYQVNAAQCERLIELLKYERLNYVTAIAVVLGAFALMIAGAVDMWFVKWGPLVMPLLWYALLSPTWLLKDRERRLIGDAAQPQGTMTLEELRYRSADLLPTPRILLWLLFFVTLVACALVIAYGGYVFDNLILLVGGIVVACIFGRNVWHWAQVYRGRRWLLESRKGVPLVFD